MKKAMATIIVTLFLASMLSTAFVTTAKAQYLTDPYTVGLWHFDEGTGTTAYDSSGYDNNGTIYGATWVDGKFGKALYFDGDDYVEIPYNSVFDIQDAITLEAWIKPGKVTQESWARIVIKGSKAQSVWQYLLTFDTTGTKIRIVLFMADGQKLEAMSTTSLTDTSKWYHVAGAYDGFNIKIYVDGVLENTTPVSPTGLKIAVGTEAESIGGDHAWLADHSFTGAIDEVRISNVARGPVDIDPDTLNLKSRGSWITAYIEVPGCTELFKDDFKTETVDNPASQWSVVTGTWLVEGEADGNKVYCQSETPTGRVTYAYLDEEFTDFIIEAKIKSISGTKGQHIAWRSDGGVNSNYYWFGWAFSPDRVRWGKFVGGVGTEMARTYRDFYSGVWYTLKVVASGSHFDMYLDGKLIFSVDDTTFASGSIGFHCGDHTHFDDVIVTSYVSEVNLSTVELHVGLETPVPAETGPKYNFVTDMYSYIVDVDEDGTLERMVKFPRATVGTLLIDYVGQEVSLTISGQYLDDTWFYLSYTVRVIKPGNK